MSKELLGNLSEAQTNSSEVTDAKKNFTAQKRSLVSVHPEVVLRADVKTRTIKDWTSHH